MQVFNNILSSNNAGIYKNNLVSANQDYLKFNSIFTLNDGDTVEFDVVLTDVLAGTGYPLSNDTRATDYIVMLSGSLIVRDRVGTNITFSYSFSNNILYNIRLERVVDDISMYVNDIFVDTQTAFGVVEFDTVGKRATLVYGDLEAYNYILNGETFSLNEANGATFTGSNGTTGTRNTSHADGLTYINNEMIERYG